MRHALTLTLLLSCAAAHAVDTPEPDVTAAVARGVEIVLERQEGADDREWPYEGVYRVRGQIPVGYRVGGTALCGLMLLQTSAPDDDETAVIRRAAAIDRATEFICEGPHQPRMAHTFESRYDVRGWGYTYGLDYLLALKRADRVPATMTDTVEEAIGFYLAGIVATEIPERGGWNYARRAGFSAPGPHAPFMTAPTLMTLFEAKTQGYDVNDAMIERGLAALERSRTATGGVHYSGKRGDGAVPGAMGRMLVTETTLYLAGRGDLARVRGAVDAFFTHWKWLEARRAKDGTHVKPYGVAPYYYYYAHYYAAVAIELLPARERDEYRARLRAILFRVRQDDGSWNDRVFDRSANYGTALAVMALTAGESATPAGWTPPVEE